MKLFKALSMFAVALSICLLISSCKTKTYNFTPQQGQKLYLSQNFWYEFPNKIYALNYKRGMIIPAGSEVVNVAYTNKSITFYLANSPQRYTMIYREGYQRMASSTFVLRLFTPKDLAQLTQGFTAAEKKFVKTGILTKGLSKKAVLVGYGYPPAHRTPSLESNIWVYWKNKFATQQLIFDENKKLISFTP